MRTQLVAASLLAAAMKSVEGREQARGYNIV
jgi:hypothetical protein